MGLTWVGQVAGKREGRRFRAGLLTQGVPGVLWDPLALRRGPLGCSADRENAIGNAAALVPRPVAREEGFQLLTVLSPQVPRAVRPVAERRLPQRDRRAALVAERGRPDAAQAGALLGPRGVLRRVKPWTLKSLSAHFNLNALKDTYDHSCFLALLDEYQH
jgi:hypothetical protein